VFVISALASAAGLIAAYVAVCLALDPFNIVHTAGPARYASNEERFSKRAIALNPAYDSYFAGSSTSRAFPIADFDREFGARFAHLTLSGGTSYEQLNLLKQLPDRRLKYLVLDLLFNEYAGNDHAPEYSDYPSSLYDGHPGHAVLVYLTCNPFLLKELYYAYWMNVQGINKVPVQDRMTPDGFINLEPERGWDASRARDEIAAVRKLTRVRMQLHTENFQSLMDIAAPRFQTIFLYFPPLHAEAMRWRLVEGTEEDRRTYCAWKRRIIAMAARYPQAVLIDYETINPVTERDDNFWDYSHVRAPVYRMLLEDFSSWVRRGRLAHPDFGQVADAAYAASLTPGSLFYPRMPTGKARGW
jgi:hypothetical protein